MNRDQLRQIDEATRTPPATLEDGWKIVALFCDPPLGSYFQLERGFDCRYYEASFAVPLADSDPRSERGYGNWQYDGEGATPQEAIWKAAREAVAETRKALVGRALGKHRKVAE